MIYLSTRGIQPNMKPMRLVALALVLSSVAALAGPKLELELGGGAVDWSAPQPTFTGRVGADIAGFFTPSLRLTSLSPFNAAAST